MSQFRTSRTFDALFLIVLGAFLWWAGVHRANLGDWVFFLRYSPTAETAQVATDAGLSDAGRHLFYRTDPQFVSKAAIVAECDIERLGCITARGQVFILDAADQHDQTVVTAAHEMLHLAYRRLPQAKKDELAPFSTELSTKTCKTASQTSSKTKPARKIAAMRLTRSSAPNTKIFPLN